MRGCTGEYDVAGDVGWASYRRWPPTSLRDSPDHLNRGGVLARSHGLVFSSAAGGAHWQIAIRCPSLPFPSVKVHQAAVLVRRFCFSMVAGCVDQNIKDPYGNTLHLHEVTFMLMAECFHRVCG